MSQDRFTLSSEARNGIVGDGHGCLHPHLADRSQANPMALEGRKAHTLEAVLF